VSRYSGEARCPACQVAFRWFLLDSKANGTAFAYCDACGATALSSSGKFGPCACGGTFRADAAPRCPECTHELVAEDARGWIEAKGHAGSDWRWQGSWQGLYCIVIENRVVSESWD
jgi:hypothetical protein